jgi:Protein of unknown function (DUF1350)
MSQINKPNFITLQDSKTRIALHPNPKGIVQFIGSFIFGSFPIWAYEYLLGNLYDRGYSLIVHRFPCNPAQFNHWEVAIELFKEQQQLKSEIVKLLQADRQPDEVSNIYLDPKNYLWLGHSLGCKYIILLEILSNDPVKRTEILKNCLKEKADLLLKQLQPAPGSQAVNSIDNDKFIFNQPSLLLAPEISNTVRLLRSGWRISNSRTSPNQKQTECLIKNSTGLFNLMGVISFNWDNIAEDDVAFIIKQLEQKKFKPPLATELEGAHFEPLGIYIDILGDRIDRSFDELKSRLT